MSKDTKTWGLILLLLLALLLWLRKRGVTTQTSVVMTDSMGNPINASVGQLRNQLNNQLTRICNYGSASLLWNTTVACPANYNGSNLVSDTTSATLQN